MAYIDRNEWNRKKSDLAQVKNSKDEIDRVVVGSKKELLNAQEKLKRETTSGFDDSKTREANELIQNEFNNFSEEIRLEIGKQNELFRREVDKIARINESTLMTIAEVDRRLSDFRQKFNNFISRIKNEEEGKRVRAVSYADHLRQIINNILTRHPSEYELLYPDILTPSALSFQDALSKVIDSIRNRDYEPAIAVAQTYIAHAIGYQSNIERIDEEYKECEAETRSALEKLNLSIEDAAASVMEIELVINDDVFQNDKDIDYWTAGIFKEIEERRNNAASMINLGIETRDINVLRESKDIISFADEKIDDCKKIAEEQFYLSCLCQETAYQIELVLTRDGYTNWRELSSAFIDTSLGETGTYRAVLANEYGTEIHILVSPNREEKKVECDIEVFDADGNTVKRDIVRSGILEELKEDSRTTGLCVRKDPYNEEHETPMIEKLRASEERLHEQWRDQTYRRLLSV